MKTSNAKKIILKNVMPQKKAHTLKENTIKNNAKKGYVTQKDNTQKGYATKDETAKWRRIFNYSSFYFS